LSNVGLNAGRCAPLTADADAARPAHVPATAAPPQRNICRRVIARFAMLQILFPTSGLRSTGHFGYMQRPVGNLDL
jgi:hypothetical protein